MNNDLFNSSYVESLMYVFNYRPYLKIDRQVYAFEDHLSYLFENAEASILRLPERAPIDTPKFMFKNRSGKQLEVSIVNTRLSFRNLRTKSIKSLIDKNANPIFNYLNSHSDIFLENLITQTQIYIPLKNIEIDIHNKLFTTFLKVERPNDLKKVSFMYEEKKEDFLYSYGVGHYDNVVIDIKPEELIKSSHNQKKEGFFIVDNEKFKILEKGLSITLTIRSDKKNLNNDDCHNLYKEMKDRLIEEVQQGYKKFLIFNL